MESVAPVIAADTASPQSQTTPAHPLDDTETVASVPQEIVGRDTPTRQLYEKITDEVAKVFVGQEELVQGTLVALFSGGHVLIESVPGLGNCLLYTSPSPRDQRGSRMPSSA